MDPRSPKWLEDIVNACRYLAEDTSGRALADLETDRWFRQVVDYNFIIIGEALRRIETRDPVTTARITDLRGAVGLRNRLVHEYDRIDRTRMWEFIQFSLPRLQRETEALLREAEALFFDADAELERPHEPE